MFIINIVDKISRDSALEMLEGYNIKFQMHILNNQKRFIVESMDNPKYRLCEAAFQMNWHQVGSPLCQWCGMINTDLESCSHLQFYYPKIDNLNINVIF